MAESVFTPRQQSLAAAQNDRPVSSMRFDLIMGLLSMVFVSGLYLDGWAHAHGRVDTTFFTPSAVSLAWLLAKPIITAPIIGANSVTQLQHSFAALNVTLITSQLAQLNEVSA